MIKICIVSAIRSDYDLLAPIIKKMNRDKDFEVKLVVTGAHMSPEFGLTYKNIEQDGIVIHKKIEMLLSSDTPCGISKSMGMAMMGFGEYFSENEFDVLMVLGDRYETLAVCCAAMNARIPIIHLYGGETTQGAIDESVRHAISKMSNLHFTSTKEYRDRVIQMGESPDRVYCVGAMGVENVMNTPLMSRDELSKSLDMDLCNPYALVTFHPVTLENNSSQEQITELLKIFDKLKCMQFVVTLANADADGRVINKMVEEYARTHKNVHVYASLGMVRYLSAIKYSECVIGNSSSGLIEVPSFKIPTINIGDRQKGRIQAESVINCEPNYDSMLRAINMAMSDSFKKNINNVVNPYGDGNTSEKVIEIIKQHKDKFNLKKKFYDIPFCLEDK